MRGKHAGASPSTEVADGICPGRHCVGAGLVLFHRRFTIPLHPNTNTPRMWGREKRAS